MSSLSRSCWWEWDSSEEGVAGAILDVYSFLRERERGEVGERKAEGWDRVLDGGGGAGWMLFDAGERLDLERIAHIGLIR